MLIDNIFVSLIKNSEYFRIVFPFLKREYFQDKADKLLFDKIQSHYIKYNKIPKYSELKLQLENDYSVSIEDTDTLNQKIDSLKKVEYVEDLKVMLDNTEQWVKDRALDLATADFVNSLDKENNTRNEKVEKIKEALAIQFVIDIGHDYFADVKKRMNSYFNKDEFFPLNIENINVAMGGGLHKKALTIFQAPPKKGKSLFLTHCAASLIASGQNVLYITMELSEKMISKRIDASLLDISMKELNETLDKKKYTSKFKTLFEKNHGQLIIKEYPSGAASATHFRNLIKELQIKKGFSPDVVIIDYINICSASSLNSMVRANSNLYVGTVCVELRAIATDFDVAILSAVQTNRGSVKKGGDDINESDIADAFSIAMHVDCNVAIVQTPEMKEQRKFMIKVVLSRFDENVNDQFMLGVIYDKMKLFNLPKEEQDIPIHIKDAMRIAKEKEDTTETRAEETIATWDFSTE